jgi:hypothetical protein
MQCENSSFQKASFSGWLMAAIFLCQRIGHALDRLTTLSSGMNREGLGTAAEFGFSWSHCKPIRVTLSRLSWSA